MQRTFERRDIAGLPVDGVNAVIHFANRRTRRERGTPAALMFEAQGETQMSLQQISIEELTNVVGGAELPAAPKSGIAERAHGYGTRPQSVEPGELLATTSSALICRG